MADAPIAVPPHGHDFTGFDYTDLASVCRCGARRDAFGHVTEPRGIDPGPEGAAPPRQTSGDDGPNE